MNYLLQSTLGQAHQSRTGMWNVAVIHLLQIHMDSSDEDRGLSTLPLPGDQLRPTGKLSEEGKEALTDDDSYRALS